MYSLNAHICSQIWPQTGLRYNADPVGFLSMSIAAGGTTRHQSSERNAGAAGGALDE